MILYGFMGRFREWFYLYGIKFLGFLGLVIFFEWFLYLFLVLGLYLWVFFFIMIWGIGYLIVRLWVLL